MRVIGYVRVSTIGQAEEGVSLEAQRARIHAWCQANGGTLADADLFVDAGISGKRASNRPGLQRALSAATEQPGAALVVYSLSRLARSLKDTILIAERLGKAGVDLVSLTEKIDTTSASGKMMFRLMAVLAEFERDIVCERTQSSVAHKRSKKERIGQLPFGRMLAPDGRTVLPNPDELAVLNDMARWSADGWTPRKIAAALDERGIRPKNDKGRWTHQSVRSILKRHESA